VNIIKNVKIPLIRVLIGDEGDEKSMYTFNISLSNSNGNSYQKHTEYIKNLLQSDPRIKPISLVIKKLTCSCNMHDASKQTFRNLVPFIMLGIFMPEVPHIEELGELLLRFLYKFGYQTDCHYQDSNTMMRLNLTNPDNIESNTHVLALQKMFKAASITSDYFPKTKKY
jgi:DNA polymerase sigma